jgi:hypothetical protein
MYATDRIGDVYITQVYWTKKKRIIANEMEKAPGKKKHLIVGIFTSSNVSFVTNSRLYRVDEESKGQSRIIISNNDEKEKKTVVHFRGKNERAFEDKVVI